MNFQENFDLNFDPDWTDPYVLLDGQTGFKICMGSYFVFLLCSGTFLDSGIICYEIYGGDPRKRGLLNQVSKIPWDGWKVVLCYGNSFYSSLPSSLDSY